MVSSIPGCLPFFYCWLNLQVATSCYASIVTTRLLLNALRIWLPYLKDNTKLLQLCSFLFRKLGAKIFTSHELHLTISNSTQHIPSSSFLRSWAGDTWGKLIFVSSKEWIVKLISKEMRYMVVGVLVTFCWNTSCISWSQKHNKIILRTYKFSEWEDAWSIDVSALRHVWAVIGTRSEELLHNYQRRRELLVETTNCSLKCVDCSTRLHWRSGRQNCRLNCSTILKHRPLPRCFRRTAPVRVAPIQILSPKSAGNYVHTSLQQKYTYKHWGISHRNYSKPQFILPK